MQRDLVIFCNWNQVKVIGTSQIQLKRKRHIATHAGFNIAKRNMNAAANGIDTAALRKRQYLIAPTKNRFRANASWVANA